MAAKIVEARVVAKSNITLATITVAHGHFTLVGTATDQSVQVPTNDLGFLRFVFELNTDVFGVGYEFTLTEVGKSTPTHKITSVTDAQGFSEDQGNVLFQ